MRLTSKPLAVLVVTLLFGGIFFSSALGWWNTTSNKQARRFTEGRYAGQADPADIRGSYTLGDVETNFGVPAAVLAQAFGIQTDEPEVVQVKSLEALYAESPQEVGTSSIRLFIAFYQNLPFDLSEVIYLPESAVQVLLQRELTPEQQAYLAEHTVPSLQGYFLEPAAPVDEANHESSEDGLVRGKTTFSDLLAWGVPAEAIEAVLGMPMPAAPGMLIRDFCEANGLSFGVIKAELQAEVDKVR